MSHFVRYYYCFHVYSVLVETNLRICAVLQEHLLLAHSVLITCAHTCAHFTCRCNYPAGFSSKFWCLNVVCACIECACGNARMVKLIWVFTVYTSVTNLPMNIKYLLHEWPKKAHVILTSCAVSPEHLTARRLIALNPHASTPSLTLCMLDIFSCFSWRLLAFFIVNFFWSVLIWVQTACIGYQQTTYVAASNERVKRTCTTTHWG